MTNFLAVLSLLIIVSNCTAQSLDPLKREINKIIAQSKAEVGVSIMAIEGPMALHINNHKHFPLQSVFKFHIALAVLHEVDQERLNLHQAVMISKRDLLPDTWSPLRDKYPDGNVHVPLSEILSYTVAQSDNNGCDILLRLLGGTEKVDHYIRRLGIEDFAIVVNEEEMHNSWNAQFKNWTTPDASTQLLKMFFEGKILGAESFDFLCKVLVNTSTGVNRLKGELPTGTPVAHKTGTSGTNTSGVTSAINDVGIVTQTSGKHYAISVYVANSREKPERLEKIISDISKLTWDYFESMED
ncbi:MAG: class A beta-lactamase, subclass A2 [Arcticibacter sp.]